MTGSRRQNPELAGAFARWQVRHWIVAFAVAVAVVVLVAIPTDLIDTPLFSREVPPTWWSYPVLAVTAVLAGLLVGTYVDDPGTGSRTSSATRESRWGGLGGVLTFFAVGCPVCNKLVLLALGTSGALQYFEPVQPLLAAGSIALLGWALQRRLRNANVCTPDPDTVDLENR